jgi:hypothetical protein
MPKPSPGPSKSCSILDEKSKRGYNLSILPAFNFKTLIHEMPYKLVELSDSEVIEKLNDTWQTVGQVRSRFGRRMAAVFVADALKRAAEKGLIERRAEGTGVQKRRGRGRFGEFSVDFYRRLPNHRDAQN